MKKEDQQAAMEEVDKFFKGMIKKYPEWKRDCAFSAIIKSENDEGFIARGSGRNLQLLTIRYLHSKIDELEEDGVPRILGFITGMSSLLEKMAPVVDPSLDPAKILKKFKEKHPDFPQK